MSTGEIAQMVRQLLRAVVQYFDGSNPCVQRSRQQVSEIPQLEARAIFSASLQPAPPYAQQLAGVPCERSEREQLQHNVSQLRWELCTSTKKGTSLLTGLLGSAQVTIVYISIRAAAIK